MIEILSPSNKTRIGRDQYEKKLNEFWERGVNSVEIDLIRGGIGFDSVRPGRNWPSSPYNIVVTRGQEPTLQEVYPCPLREALPVFSIPLRGHEPDLPFDLQPLIDLCYERGRYWMLDYSNSPSPSIGKDDLEWAQGILKAS